jgi:hypothetical protein
LLYCLIATPEHDLPSNRLDELKKALVAVENHLEIADENENPIERTASREALLERYDQIQEGINAIEIPTENAQSVPGQVASEDTTREV